MWRRSKPGVLCFAVLIPVVTVFSPAAMTVAILEAGMSRVHGERFPFGTL